MFGISGSRATGSLGTLSTGEGRQSLPTNTTSEVGAEPEVQLEDATEDVQSTSCESQWLRQTPQTPSLEQTELGLQDGTITTEETVRENLLPDVQSLMKALKQDKEEEDIPEISQLTVTEKSASLSRVRHRREQRLHELSRPKTNWQSVKDRPSVYWTERFLEDTTLTITVPTVSPRVEELSRPKRFYLEYYSNNRTTPIWPIPRTTLEYHPTNRLKKLAVPKIRNNIWNMDMSEVLQVSRAAQTAVPSPRILNLAKPKDPTPLLEEWDPMPKPKTHVSDYNRLLQLAMPKAHSEKCVPDRSPRWEILDGTKKAVASERILSLARPKIRRDLNEGYDPFHVSPASQVAQASPRIYELAVPKSITKKV